MVETTNNSSSSFSTTLLPVVNKKVFRMGVAGNYGLQSSDILWAAERGANYWLWGASFKKVTDGIKEVIRTDREKHVIAMLGWGYFGRQIRRSVENALRTLKTEYLDVFKLGWLGRTSIYSKGTVGTLLQLKKEGKIRAIGTSIHDRHRAGMLALDSAIDLFMIRYNAKHPGAEKDIFPFLSQRKPAVISYTALAWGQLTKSLKDITMPPWPGDTTYDVPPLHPDLCYQFVLSNPNVHVVLTGPQNRQQLEQNLKAVDKGALNPDELDWIQTYGRLVKTRKKFDYIR